MKIVTICGSMKYQNEMMIAAEEMALAGNCVLAPVYPVIEGIVIKDDCKKSFDEAHFKRIEMSDAILVVNIDNYIGNSTKKEIEYAESLEKEVIYYTDWKSK